jgi:ABC-type antimicrobial peptide transport system permease subunit
MKNEMEEGLIETSPLSVELVNLKITFTLQIFIVSVLLTFLLGTIGSLIPAFYISKLRPAEVLRFG